MSIDKDFQELYTFSEATKKYGLTDGSTLRKAVQRGRFQEGEIKKVGTTWVVTKAAMDRLYGDYKKDISSRIKDAKKKAAEQNPKGKSNVKNVQKEL